MKHPVPVAVTGLGCICAAGKTLPETLAALFRGERAPAPSRRFATSYPTPFPVFEVTEDFAGRDDLLRTSLLALAAAGEALADAGWSRESLRPLRVGVCLGTTVGSAMNNEDFYREYRQGQEPSLAPIRRFLHSNPAASLAKEYSFDGPCQTVVNACSSGSDAVGLAGAWIRAGICDLALAGGADELCRTTCNGFHALMIASDAPVTPFDRRRKGLNLGEGAGVLVLESEALRSSRPARAFLRGYGAACDAYHLTAPHPDGAGLKRALREALTEAGATAQNIAFVNAHGTGTVDNDRVESRVLAEVLPNVPFLSTKGYTGHTLGAAGGIEAALTVACLELGKIPASIGFAEPDSEQRAVPVTRTTTVAGDLAISQSLAFGGNNAVLVFGRGAR
ncbi:beta-ketoacyl-[acyl-carrier-protein] synthase family protein [Trichloromonas sp.]|uniref:beta-ketoacyl-[acyl-carrier-protein] synthase family protein n=1 Tax=Trichloromonas sp. TaxID=3069249 RepID=UPI002A3BBB5E|nr:beta-ketoacyl-[acyl-carrier-protein] synthase family protein [Trichloromonas sp.]